MSKVRVEGHLLEDRNVMVCSGEAPDELSWARDAETGQVFVVLEQISPDDVLGQPRDQESPRYFGLRLFGGAAALPKAGRILEVA